jgi:Putative polyhydroxyalkanoic acid system protein (PHA_gran_rgn)
MFLPMQRPIDVNMPHKLGREEARRRIATNIHSLKDHIPGGATMIDSSWAGDTLTLKIHAMGQAVDAHIAVEETRLNVRVMLSGMLAMFAGPIEAALNHKGSELLLEDKSKR